MRKCTFRDETHSALKKIERSVSLIKQYNDARNALVAMDALRKVKLSLNLIRCCDRMICDDRRFRSNPGAKKPTVWEMQELIGSPHFTDDGQRINGYDMRYEGKFGPNGDYLLYDRVSRKLMKTITRQDMDKRFAEFMAKMDTTKVSKGSAGYGGGGAINRSSLAQPGIAPATLYEEDPNKAIGIMSKVAKAVKLVSEALAVFGGVGVLAGGASAIKNSGDTLAEVGNQLGRFKNFIVEKAASIKNKLFGNKNPRIRH